MGRTRRSESVLQVNILVPDLSFSYHTLNQVIPGQPDDQRQYP